MPQTPGVSARAPRTQAMRRAQTRARLLDSTVQCLIELGYAGTTTPVVCERARLSRGALLHHFPTKIELVIAAVAHLAARTGEKIRARAPSSAGATRAGRLDASLELIWQSFSGPLFYAALELWVAARTDAELHEHLYALERTLGKAIAQVCESLLEPTPAERAAYRDQVELTLYMLRGMALQRILRPDDGERRRLFGLWKRMVANALSPEETKP
jgi:AcrR family transcriptional regulator